MHDDKIVNKAHSIWMHAETSNWMIKYIQSWRRMNPWHVCLDHVCIWRRRCLTLHKITIGGKIREAWCTWSHSTLGICSATRPTFLLSHRIEQTHNVEQMDLVIKIHRFFQFVQHVLFEFQRSKQTPDLIISHEFKGCSVHQRSPYPWPAQFPLLRLRVYSLKSRLSCLNSLKIQMLGSWTARPKRNAYNVQTYQTHISNHSELCRSCPTWQHAVMHRV